MALEHEASSRLRVLGLPCGAVSRPTTHNVALVPTKVYCTSDRCVSDGVVPPHDECIFVCTSNFFSIPAGFGVPQMGREAPEKHNNITSRSLPPYEVTIPTLPLARSSPPLGTEYSPTTTLPLIDRRFVGSLGLVIIIQSCFRFPTLSKSVRSHHP